MAADLLGTMRVEIVGDNKKLDKSIKDSKKSTDTFGKSTAKLGANLGKLFAGIGFAVVAKKLFDLGKQAENLFKVQELAETKLDATLKATGFAAGLTADQLKKMASELQNVTTFGDEATIGAQTLLLTFKNIGEDTFPRALESILDVSTAMGTGLKESSIQVGKALNDPVGGIAALTRVGIQFTKEQKDTIKSMVEMNDIAGAQGVILDELESQFGGVARAVALTADGISIQLDNAFGDLLETIGGVISEGAIPYRQELTKQITVINQNIQAHLLRKQVLEGSATLVEELTLRQIEQRRAEEKLAQAVLNVKNVREREIDTTRLSEVQIRQRNNAVAIAIAKADLLIEGLQDEVKLRRLTTEEVKKQVQEEQDLIAANILLVESIEDKTEATEENTKTTNEGITTLQEEKVAFEATSERIFTLLKERAILRGELTEAAKEDIEEIGVSWEDMTTTSLSQASDFFDALGELSRATAQNQIDDINRVLETTLTAIDAETEALLVSLGLQEETRTEKLERQLEEAVLNGDAETAEQLQDQIDRIAIIEAAEQSKTDAIEAADAEKNRIEFDAALKTWRLQKLSALSGAAQAVISGYASQPFIPVGLAAGTTAAALGLIQIGVINQNKPQSFASGGVVAGSDFTGDKVPAMVNSREMILTQSQQAQLFALANGGNTTNNNNSGGNININSMFSLGNDAKLNEAAERLFPALQKVGRRRGVEGAF